MIAVGNQQPWSSRCHKYRHVWLEKTNTPEMPEIESDTDFRRVHRRGWPSTNAAVLSGAGLLTLAGFLVGAYIVPTMLTTMGQQPAPSHDGIQSVIRENPVVEVVAPVEDRIELAEAKARLTAMVVASSPRADGSF